MSTSGTSGALQFPHPGSHGTGLLGGAGGSERKLTMPDGKCTAVNCGDSCEIEGHISANHQVPEKMNGAFQVPRVDACQCLSVIVCFVSGNIDNIHLIAITSFKKSASSSVMTLILILYRPMDIEPKTASVVAGSVVSTRFQGRFGLDRLGAISHLALLQAVRVRRERTADQQKKDETSIIWDVVSVFSPCSRGCTLAFGRIMMCLTVHVLFFLCELLEL